MHLKLAQSKRSVDFIWTDEPCTIINTYQNQLRMGERRGGRGGRVCFGGVLAAPDVPIFKSANLVTELGV